MPLHRTLIAALVAVLFWSAPAAWAAPFSEIVVFGDSLSDTGNLFIRTLGLAPDSPPYYLGRFSDGPLWVERLAEQLVLTPPAPSLDGGTDSAFGGAKTGSGTTSFIIPNLGRQISNYLSDHTLNATEIVVVWGGANDLLEGSGADPAAAVANLAGHIATLEAAGAENFFVPNLPPLGQTPRFVGGSDEALMDGLTSQFNSLLATELDDLESSLDINLYPFDVFSLMQDLLSDPAAAGLTNVTQPALDPDTGTPVANPQEYLFWDDLHPTTVCHGRLGDEAALVVVPTYALGDADADGDVDTADLTTMLQQSNGSGGRASLFPDGDTDGDGDVDTADLTSGFQNFTGADVPLPLAVPEPGGLLLALAGLVSCGLGRRRRRLTAA